MTGDEGRADRGPAAVARPLGAGRRAARRERPSVAEGERGARFPGAVLRCDRLSREEARLVFQFSTCGMSGIRAGARSAGPVLQPEEELGAVAGGCPPAGAGAI